MCSIIVASRRIETNANGPFVVRVSLAISSLGRREDLAVLSFLLLFISPGDPVTREREREISLAGRRFERYSEARIGVLPFPFLLFPDRVIFLGAILSILRESVDSNHLNRRESIWRLSSSH